MFSARTLARSPLGISVAAGAGGGQAGSLTLLPRPLGLFSPPLSLVDAVTFNILEIKQIKLLYPVAWRAPLLLAAFPGTLSCPDLPFQCWGGFLNGKAMELLYGFTYHACHPSPKLAVTHRRFFGFGF